MLSGLADGERWSTSANFLLDSESSLQAALSRHAPRTGAAPRRAPALSEPHDPRPHPLRAPRTGSWSCWPTAVVVGYGVYTLRHIPVDAIPDLSDTQVIVYSRWDRSPDIIEDQVTYPIVTALLGAPNVKVDPRLLRLRLLATST